MAEDTLTNLAEPVCLSVFDEVLVLHRSLQIRGEVEVEEQELKRCNQSTDLTNGSQDRSRGHVLSGEFHGQLLSIS
jgi:hypothetical protein